VWLIQILQGTRARKVPRKELQACMRFAHASAKRLHGFQIFDLVSLTSKKAPVGICSMLLKSLHCPLLVALAKEKIRTMRNQAAHTTSAFLLLKSLQAYSNLRFEPFGKEKRSFKNPICCANSMRTLAAHRKAAIILSCA